VERFKHGADSTFDPPITDMRSWNRARQARLHHDAWREPIARELARYGNTDA